MAHGLLGERLERCRTFAGDDGFSGTWRVSDRGEHCYESPRLSSCQTLVLLNGKGYFLDEQGRHRSTIDECG